MLHRRSTSTSTSTFSARNLHPRPLPRVSPRIVAAASAAPGVPSSTSTPPEGAESSRGKDAREPKERSDRSKGSMRAARTLVARALATPAPRRGASSGSNNSKRSGIEAAAVATTSSPSSSPPDSASTTADDVADIVLGIDPDTRGAMAVLLRRSSTSFASSSTDDDGGDDGMRSSSDDSFSISAVHDTPTIEVPLGRGTLKKPPKTRRRLDAERVALLVSELKENAESSGKTIEAIVEQPSPSPLNGKLAWYGSGLAFGVWTGVLAAKSVPTSFVRAQEWKRAFGLEGGGKDAARAAAVEALDDDEEVANEQEQLPTAASFLQRKKDHGRADAMLIALWRTKGGSSWGGVEADNNNDVDEGEEEEEESSSSSSGSDDEGTSSSTAASATATTTTSRRPSSAPKAPPSFGPNSRGPRRSRGFSSLARCRALPSASNDGGSRENERGAIDFASYTFIVDDVVFADGHGDSASTAMGLVGGAGPQALFGYAIAHATLHKLLKVPSSPRIPSSPSSASEETPPLSLALVAGINRLDLPAAARTWLSDAERGYGVSRGVSWMDGTPTPRAWQLVEADGTRTQVWRKSFDFAAAADALLPPLPLPFSPPSPPAPPPRKVEVPRSVVREARAHHVGVDPLNASHLRWLEGLREMTTSEDVEAKTRTRITSETFQECSRRPTALELSRLLWPLDLFSPNEAEAASMVGGGGELAEIAAAKKLLLAAEGGRGRTSGFLDSVVVRCGASGSALVRRNRWGLGSGERPYSAFRVPAVTEGLRLRDTTGCGNSFLGALAAAAAFPFSSSPGNESDDVLSRDPAMALGVASASAAAVAEVVGTPRLHPDELLSSGVVELAAERAVAVRARCEEVDDF